MITKPSRVLKMIIFDNLEYKPYARRGVLVPRLRWSKKSA